MISKAEVKSQLKALMDAAFAATENPAAAQDAFVDGLADVVCNNIVKGINEATVTPALSNGAGAVTGTITIEAEVAP